MVVAGALLLGSCGGSNPSDPNPPEPGGTVVGNYLLEILPGASCNGAGTTLPRGPYSFPMGASAGGSIPHPGVQVVLDGAPSALELELKYTDFTLRGGFGATQDGVLTNEGLRLWIRTIGTGAVTHVGDGRGEVTAGTLIGYLAVGAANAEEAAAAACSATDHTFTLKVR